MGVSGGAARSGGLFVGKRFGFPPDEISSFNNMALHSARTIVIESLRVETEGKGTGHGRMAARPRYGSRHVRLMVQGSVVDQGLGKTSYVAAGSGIWEQLLIIVMRQTVLILLVLWIRLINDLQYSQSIHELFSSPLKRNVS